MVTILADGGHFSFRFCLFGILILRKKKFRKMLNREILCCGCVKTMQGNSTHHVWIATSTKFLRRGLGALDCLVTTRKNSSHLYAMVESSLGWLAMQERVALVSHSVSPNELSRFTSRGTELNASWENVRLVGGATPGTHGIIHRYKVKKRFLNLQTICPIVWAATHHY